MHPLFSFLSALLLIILLLGTLSGCQHQSVLPPAASQIPHNKETSTKPPYGVYDIQGRHGNGQWKDNPERLVR